MKFLAIDNKLGCREVKLFTARTARERFAVVESDDGNALKRHADEVSRAGKRDATGCSHRRLVRAHRFSSAEHQVSKVIS